MIHATVQKGGKHEAHEPRELALEKRKKKKMTWIDNAIHMQEFEARNAAQKAEALKEIQKQGAVRDLVSKFKNIDTILEVWEFMQYAPAPKNVKLRLADVEAITREPNGEVVGIRFANEKYGVNHSIEWDYDADKARVVMHAS